MMSVRYSLHSFPAYPKILKHDKAEAEELVRNMRMTAQFIEEEELRKENEGLIIEEAWFGAIMDSVDPNLTIEDMVEFQKKSLF